MHKTHNILKGGRKEYYIYDIIPLGCYLHFGHLINFIERDRKHEGARAIREVFSRLTVCLCVGVCVHCRVYLYLVYQRCIDDATRGARKVA